MPITTCQCCRSEFHWQWEEAFDKFGFDDGDAQVETPKVVNALTRAGYAVSTETLDLHNTIIVSIEMDGQELMPLGAQNIRIGYDDARRYLPEEIVRILDRAF